MAVSGGVDSMVLLDLLAKQAKSQKPKAKSDLQPSALSLELIVAHFDHGIRADSCLDAELVRKTAKEYSLKFETKKGRLSANASENTARQSRYTFLESIRREHKARAIITAHHQDDLIETAFLNLLRGTKHRGLSSISTNQKVLRPLLPYSKREIINYAKKHNLTWHEDMTNEETKYLRNYLRIKILPKLTSIQRGQLVKNIDNVAKLTKSIDSEIATISQSLFDRRTINRQRFTMLPIEVANELMAVWLRREGLRQTDKKLVNRLVNFVKTGQPGLSSPVRGKLHLKLDKQSAHFS